ncbi:dedicator of cytokinesis protein 1-like [Oscarella lobularis]|uniref:dedicator of cytokinesis protein 1-like n=1 Tax=Oscarella lobularis TaxID=121494 RepID=UPI0033130CFE
MTAWEPTTNAKYGVVIYNYEARSDRELTLKFGETVQILEQCGGWYRGWSLSKKDVLAIFPSSFIHLKPCHVENPGQLEAVVSQEDPVVREVTSVLREWGVVWKNAYSNGDMKIFGQIKNAMLDLLKWRKLIMGETLPQDKLMDLKRKVMSKINWGNWKLSLDMVLWKPDGKPVEPDRISVHELFSMHLKNQEEIESAGTRSGTVRMKKVLSLASSLPSSRQREPRGHHLVISFTCFIANIGEEVDICFSIYDHGEGKFLNENYIVKLSKQGMVLDLSILNSTFGVFEDLSEADLKKKLYLACFVFRIGTMRQDKKGPTCYRRPYGCGVFSLQTILSQTDSSDPEDFSIPILQVHSGNDNDFYKFHEAAIKAKSADRVVATGQLVHGDLEQLKIDKPTLFPRGTGFAKRLGFADLIMPGEIRNDLFVTVGDGDFDRGSKKSAKNVEVSMKVVNNDGGDVMNCIWVGAGIQPVSEYRSYIMVHNSHPVWNETIRVTVPVHTFYDCHLRFTFRHCSTTGKEEKHLLFAFLKLKTRDETTLLDDRHELYVYRAQNKSILTNPKRYLDLPASSTHAMFSGLTMTSSGTGNDVGLSRNEREKFTVSTLICSTKLTQNTALLSLLKWREKKDSLKDVLNNVSQVKGDEIVRFLQDTFDALFGILNEESREFDHSQKVFDALVYILDLLQKQKYKQFRPVLEAYVQHHFAAPLAYEKLLVCFKHNLENVANPSKEFLSKLLSTMTALEFIFKFIIQSRHLYARALRGQNLIQFKESVQSAFVALNHMIGVQMPHLESVQQIAHENFPTIYTDLLTCFDVTEVALFVQNFLSATKNLRSNSVLIQARLTCMLATVNSELFRFIESRAVLLPSLLAILRDHLIKKEKEEEEICAKLFDVILTRLQTAECETTPDDVTCVVQTMFYLLIGILQRIDSTSALAGQHVVNLIAMLKLMKESHFRDLMASYREKPALKTFLLDVFFVFEKLTKARPYPAQWRAMYMLQNNVLVHAIQAFSVALQSHFLFGSDFETPVWDSFFNLSVAFITQPSLQLETFSPANQAKILDKYGDIRSVMGFEVFLKWQSLGQLQLEFVPHLIGPFVAMTLVPKTDLRKSTMPIFFDMMEIEAKERGDFKQVETELIDQLDENVGAGKGDAEYKDLLCKILVEKSRGHATLAERGVAFSESVGNLLERLLDYRKVESTEENRFKKTMCTVNLLNYYRDQGREEMYTRYVMKLCELHLESGDFAEAGFTILLYANRLKWSNFHLLSVGKYQTETEASRKERLLKQAIAHFDQGKVWEKGIQLCKSLAQQYEEELFDYKQLSDMLQTQARFYGNITQGLRQPPEYFCVGFFGLGFPTFMTNKRFIFRGGELDKLGDFTARIKVQCPSAEFMMTLDQPGNDILTSDGQFVQICRVAPTPEIPKVFAEKNAAEYVFEYYKFNDVNKFLLDRPFHRGTKDKSVEIKTLWYSRTTFTTSHKLPGVMRWAEVTSLEKVEMNPLEVAIDQMTQSTQKLRETVKKYTGNSSLSVNPLSMMVNGMVEAAVMGGIKNYQKVFFIPQYLTENPQHVRNLETLKSLIREQLTLLESAIEIHGKLAPIDLKPLQVNFETNYNELKRDVFKNIFGEVSASPDVRRRQLDRSLTVAHKPTHEGLKKTSSRSTVVGPPRKASIPKQTSGADSPIQQRPLPKPPSLSPSPPVDSDPVPPPRRMTGKRQSIPVSRYEDVTLPKSSSTGNLLDVGGGGGANENEENTSGNVYDSVPSMTSSSSFHDNSMSKSDPDISDYDSPTRLPPQLPPKKFSAPPQSSQPRKIVYSSPLAFKSPPLLPVKMSRRGSSESTPIASSILPPPMSPPRNTETMTMGGASIRMRPRPSRGMTQSPDGGGGNQDSGLERHNTVSGNVFIQQDRQLSPKPPVVPQKKGSSAKP